MELRERGRFKAVLGDSPDSPSLGRTAEFAKVETGLGGAVPRSCKRHLYIYTHCLLAGAINIPVLSPHHVVQIQEPITKRNSQTFHSPGVVV